MWAILSLDIFAVVFWLGTMAALAAFRGSFTIPVEVYYGKRALLVADNIYLGIMVAAIITSAIEMYAYQNQLSNNLHANKILQDSFHCQLSHLWHQAP